MQHVLVVDRQPRLRRLVRDALEGSGEYRVSCAANGKHAVPVFDRDRPRLVVLDFALVGMPAIEVAAHATQRGIPIVVTTEEAEMDDRLTRLGWPCVMKPIHRSVADASARHARGVAQTALKPATSATRD